MRNVPLAALVVLAAIPVTAFAQGYTKSTSTTGYSALTGDTTIFDGGAGTYDDQSQSISIGFTFEFYGNEYTSLLVGSNGFVSFDSTGATDYENASIPSTGAPNRYIALFWDDLVVKNVGTTDRVSYKLTGTAPNRVLVIQYAHVSIFDNNTAELSGQIRLHETSNRIELDYASSGNDWTGVTATIGIEDTGGYGGLGGPNTGNSNSTQPSTGYRFDPTTANVTGTLRYEDKTYSTSGFTGGTTYKVGPYIRVELEDAVTGVLLTSATTTSAGAFTLSSVGMPSRVRVRFYADSGAVAVQQTTTGSPYNTYLDQTTSGTTTALGNVDHSIAAVPSMASALNIIDTILQGYAYALDRTEESSLPAITVIWSTGTTTGTYYTGTRIYLLGSSSDTDEYDDDVILHEYGHHVMNSLSTDPSPGGSHSWATPSSRALAWSEGFATYFSCVVQRRSTYTDTSSQGAFSLDCEPPTSSPYGANVEGAIAGILWDMHDGRNEAHDYQDGTTGTVLGEDQTFEVLDTYMDGRSGNDIDVFLTGLDNRGYSAREITGAYIHHGVHVDTANEPNDELGVGVIPRGATLLPASGTLTAQRITLWNDDVIRIPISTSGVDIEVTIAFTHSLGDLDLEVYGPTGTLLGTSYGVTNSETVALDSVSSGTYYARVFGFQNATNTYSLSFRVPVAIVTTSLADWTAGLTFSDTLEADGGLGALSWHVSSGHLPEGFILFSTGALWGIPDSAATETFDITVTDSTGTNSATRTFTWVVNPAPEILTTSMPAWTQGADYHRDLTFSGGTPPIAWTLSAGSLPDGLSADGAVDGSTRWVEGTPTGPTTASFSLTMTDANGASDTRPFSLTINPRPSLLGTTFPDWTVGHPYSAAPSVSGGTTPFSWRLSNGSLPAGIDLGADGSLSGTPTTAGDTTFDVELTDAAGVMAVHATDLTINPSVAVGTTGLPDWTRDIAFSQNASATGGTGALSWSTDPTTLPTGVTLSAGGALSGTPTVDGTFSITLTANDTVGASAEQSFDWTINPPVQIDTTTMPAWTEGRPYDQTVATSGGTAPISIQVSSGQLPQGLSIDDAGRITGSPGAAGTSTFGVSVSDVRGSSAYQELSLRVNQPPAIGGLGLEGIVVAQDRHEVRSVGGDDPMGTPPLHWSVVSGVLPTGLVLNTKSGEIVGTTSAVGAHPVTIRVQDEAGASAETPAAVFVATPLIPKRNMDDTIAGQDDARYWFFDAIEGTEVSLKTNFPRARSGIPELTFRDPTNAEHDLGTALQPGKSAVKVKKWKTPTTGRVFVRLDRTTSGYSGSVRQKLTLKAPKAFSESDTIGAGDGTYSLRVHALAGSLLKTSIRTQNGGTRLALDALLDPDGDEVDTEPYVRADAGPLIQLDNLLLIKGGEHVIVIRLMPGASSGAFSATTVLKPPPTYQYVYDN